METPEKNKIREHKADGIEEYDNPLPRWWVGLFYFTIIFSVVYMLYFHAFGGHSLTQDLEESQKIRATHPHSHVPVTAETSEDLAQKFKDPAVLNEGKELFTANCVPCHGAHGEGGVGPNLTDEFWIHGGSEVDVVRTIAKGVPEKGMISWEPILGIKKVEALAAYVLSMQGTNPPNAKAPQGEPYKRN